MAMRLALITRRYPPLIGGAEKVLSYLAPALAAEGAEVTVLTSRVPGPASAAVEEVAATPGRLTVVRLATSRLRFLGTWLYMRNLRRWLARNPIDLAYVSMLKHDAFTTIAEGRRQGFPVVLRPEGAGATGDLAWQSWGRFGRTIGRRCRLADAVVSISRAITAELLAAGYDATRIHELPNGVPVPDPPWRAAPTGGPRRAPSRRPAGAREGARDPGRRLAPRPGGPSRARLTLIGEGPERPALEALVDRLGLRGAVELPGPMTDPDAALRAADLFVLPSREEGMSIALLEAMALGMPLVASAIPGNRRLVRDFKDGRLAPPDDPDALARAILEQWADFDRAVHMGRAARRRVADEFSIAAVARRHLELFRRLVQEKATRSPMNPGAASCSTSCN